MSAASLLSKIYQLLAPPTVTCLGCGRLTRHSSGDFSELCLDCAGSIPWISSPRCPICGRGIGCPDCSRGDWAQHRSFVLNRSAVMYNEQMREWLGQYKYRGRETLAPVLGKMVRHAYKRLKEEQRLVLQDPAWQADVVTCVPVSPSRLMERGFNQAEVLAKAVAEEDGLYIPLLGRTRDTEKQSLKSRSERLMDMKAAFIPLPGASDLLSKALCSHGNRLVMEPTEPTASKCTTSERPLRVLLIDDIYTTGSTIGACSVQLRNLIAPFNRRTEVYSLTWARS